MTFEEATRIITQIGHTPVVEPPKINEPFQPLPPENREPPSDNTKRNRLLLWFSIALVVLAIIWLLVYLLYLQYYESTDDAYANGNLININSVISGSVIAFYADNTDLVKEGQLLVELDPTEYIIKYEQSLAALASTVLQVRQLYTNVTASKANLENKTVLLARARYDYDNRSNLIGTEAVSKEDYTHSKDDVAIAKTAVKQAEAQLTAAIDAAGNTPLEQHPILEQARANVREAYYYLKHCNIYAPYGGFVAQRTVNVGQRVGQNTPIMAIIPKDYVWVDANFKETQLTHMRIGQPVTTWFDIYGSSVKYKGKVLGIASGTGSVFSLIPPQNATGNWIKIVQRLPVRISLDPEQVKDFPIRLGISAEVTVDISDQDLPMLAVESTFHPIATTKIFDIQWGEINKIIDDVIKANLLQDVH